MWNHALKAVGPERAALAAGIPVRGKHEMLHHELVVACEQFGEAHFAVRTLERIVLVHLHPGQRLSLFDEPVPRLGELLLMRHVRLAGFDPFLARRDLVWLYGRLL